MQAKENIFKKASIIDKSDIYTGHIKQIFDKQNIDTEILNSISENIDSDITIRITNKQIIDNGSKVLNKKPLVIAPLSAMNNDEQNMFYGMLSRINPSKTNIFNNAIKKQGEYSIERLKTALDNNEFELWYQPITKSANEKISGFEALIRWKDSETGKMISPDKFISTIEDDELIIPFGFRIIEEACKNIKKWSDILGAEKHFRVSVNLSARQFTCEKLVEKIIEIVKDTEIDPSNLALEITESAFMEDMSIANMMLLKLRSNHIKIYLDDFGSGYSSLAYLLHFPVDVIKIDMSFVKWMHIDEQSEAIVHSVIELAHNLKMLVVAEGVEYIEHVNLLREFECDYYQGYYFSKPLCGKDAEEYLKNNM